ncbi:MAG TPA: CopG family transcriptional regulator [Giesbergeria sp.]|nr:CopG family transcriptional regulator [Giesbergeria sp.]
MRTTIDLEPDTLMAAKELARQENVSLGKVVSRLLRLALTGQVGHTGVAAPVGAASATGFVPFAQRGVVVSNELIDKLRDSEGV